MKSMWHTGITVNDLDVSVSFYRDVLGLKVQVAPTDWFEGEELSDGLGVENAILRLCILEIGDSGDMLEMLEYKNPASAINKPMPPNTIGTMHVSFRVCDINNKIEELEAKGIKFFTKPNMIDEGPLAGWQWVYFTDPDGIIIELVQYDVPK